MNSVKSGGSRGSKRSKRSNASSTSSQRRMFSELQRGQLKQVLTKKFKKKYKDQEAKWIQGQVSQFVDANDDLNSKKLKTLENCIAKGQDALNSGGKADDELSNRSGISRMSGATDFNKFEDKNQKVKSKQMLELEERRRKQQEEEQAKKNRPNVRFEFVKEEDEWAAIARYNKYLFDKREYEKRDNEQRAKVQMFSDLQEQQSIKRNAKSQQAEEDALYHAQVLKNLERMKAREEREKEEYHRKQMEEKVQRDHQLFERRVKRKADVRKQKAIDRFIVKSIKHEQRKEKANQEKRKAKEKEISKKILSQNEVKRKLEAEKDERERLENIAMQQAYTKLIEEQEKKRADSFAQREAKLKQFSDMNAKLFGEIKQSADKRLNEKMLRYQNRRNRQLDEREQARVDKIERNKVELKSFLFKQIDEKNLRETTEKADNFQQAEIWKEEKLEFDKYEKSKQDKIHNAYMKFSKELKTQIESNKEKKKANKFIMNAEENLFNKKLLNDIQGLSIEGQSLH